MMERWRAVTGYEGLYEVSDHGRVRSLDREAPHNTAKTQRVAGRLLSPTLNQHGYPVVGLRGPGGLRRFFRVHRLVAAAFVPNPENKPQVNHLDHDRANSHWANLEWSTQVENLAHMTAAGRRGAYWAGRRGPRATIPGDIVQRVREARADGFPLARLAVMFGLSKRTVQRIVNRETYADV